MLPHTETIFFLALSCGIPFLSQTETICSKEGEGIKTQSGVGGRRRHSVGKAVQCNGPLNNAHGARNPSGELGCETRTFLVLNPDLNIVIVNCRRKETYSLSEF